ncbi:hypothetical protein H310_07255 [Aphanomyces invadans]|uniref:Uncharacterized protein n=1 Tax=Aphanomyces invadans TaxID=157072 RepID=A0A024U465_9STRA|nr:hypothetical protein H310_07255 [Aphanomyces invadans]ETW00697.1 hypothetical protein H310_07255 [Aphanomyces invadans]|eukprot:XP_008870832.1 hypothetical protein H310_07255 [Aphanomyces invadans]
MSDQQATQPVCPVSREAQAVYISCQHFRHLVRESRAVGAAALDGRALLAVLSQPLATDVAREEL